MKNSYKLKEQKSAEAILKKIAISRLFMIVLMLCIVSLIFTSSDLANLSVAMGEDLPCSVGGVSQELSSNTKMLYPGGMPFGVKIKTKGVLVVELGDVSTSSGNVCPGKDGGVCVGDVIVRVSGKDVNTVRELSSAINESNGNQIIIEAERDGRLIALCLRPVFSQRDNIFRAGIYVRDNTAGIGTVTFIDPENGNFAGLGHGICEGKTGCIMPLGKGEVCDVIINRVIKGRNGAPGELRGCLGTVKTGKIVKNCHTGVYGNFDEIPSCEFSKPMPIANPEQVREGKAHILCSVDSNGICKYEIEISKVKIDNTDTRNYSIKVTDQSLIAKTGGIVQGMSGSPIIQDGRIIGAVTHVLLDDPTAGYGIFIGNMISNMPD